MSVHITVVGNIADVPQRASLPTGETVVRFPLAVTLRRQEDGVWKDVHTSWYRVSGYRQLAENALQSFQKGQRVVVTGRLRMRRWEANGKQGTDAEIDADAFGHDLKFGTSSFHSPQRPDSAVERVERTDAEEWSPATPAPQQGAPAAMTDVTQTPESVPATTWDTTPLGSSPPAVEERAALLDPTPF